MGGLARANGAPGLPEGDLEGAAAGGESQFPGPPNPGAHFLGSLHTMGRGGSWSLTEKVSTVAGTGAQWYVYRGINKVFVCVCSYN